MDKAYAEESERIRSAVVARQTSIAALRQGQADSLESAFETVYACQRWSDIEVHIDSLLRYGAVGGERLA